MKITTYLDHIKEFRSLFNQFTPSHYGEIRAADLKLAASLILEEAAEYHKAPSRATTIDGLGDTAYVTFQACAAAHITPADYSETLRFPIKNTIIKPNILPEVTLAFRELTKPRLCYNGLYTSLTALYWKLEQTSQLLGFHLPTVFLHIHASNLTKLWKANEVTGNKLPNDLIATPTHDGNHFIVTNKDGKVIKSPSYTPVDLSNF